MSPVRTLIVEDSNIILDNLVETLEELTEVRVIGTTPDEEGAGRWIEINQQCFDLLIIDIFLKSGSGLGVLRRAVDAGLKVPRVVLTNYATDDMRRCCIELGATRVFDKSSELEELIDYCDKIADGHATRSGDLS